MKEIGGYFELELPVKEDFIHSEGLLLNSGRHALEFIISTISPPPTRIFLPYYTCEVVLQSIKKNGIRFSFYKINDRLEISSLPSLGKNEYIIVNNYFGIKDEYIKRITEFYQDRIIIDQAQAWYAPAFPKVKSFYSPRKFFGIPDGGIALGVDNINLYESLPLDYSWQRFNHLLKRCELSAIEGYNDFREVASSLSKQPIKKMSILTQLLLSSINMGEIRTKRRHNFEFLHKSLKTKNQIVLPSIDSYACPMIYPLYIEEDTLRKNLIDNSIFVATYWPNIIKNQDYKKSFEYNLAKYLIPLPIDQRYGEEEMKNILKIINV